MSRTEHNLESEESLDSTKTKVPRRTFLKGLILSLGFLGIKLTPALSFVRAREPLVDKINIKQIEEILTNEYCENLLSELNLPDIYNETLNVSSFKQLLGKTLRLASIYHAKETEKKEEPIDFSTYAKEFILQMYSMSENINFNFVSALLMFQVSGENTEGVASYSNDVTIERKRYLAGVLRRTTGEKFYTKIIEYIVDKKLLTIYELARLAGPITLGIHDMESVQIAKAVAYTDQNSKANKKHDASQDRSSKIDRSLQLIKQTYESLDESRDILSIMIGEVSRELEGSDKLTTLFKRVLTQQNGQVDLWQLSRPTTFWKYASNTSFPGDQGEALNETLLEYNEKGGLKKFLFDNVENDKLQQELKNLFKENIFVKKLIPALQIFKKIGDKVIDTDRATATVLGEKELNQTFQLSTGLAYGKMMTDKAKELLLEKGEQIDESNPHHIAALSFFATSFREISPMGYLAGTKPLSIADPLYATPDVLFEDMYLFMTDKYPQQVSIQESTTKGAEFKKLPSFLESFTTFHYFFRTTMANKTIDTITYKKERLFWNFFKNGGYHKKFFSPPYSSWMRTSIAGDYLGAFGTEIKWKYIRDD